MSVSSLSEDGLRFAIGFDALRRFGSGVFRRRLFAENAHEGSFAVGQHEGLCLFYTSVSIKAVAAVATNDKVAIALHHAISRLALIVLGL